MLISTIKLLKSIHHQKIVLRRVGRQAMRIEPVFISAAWRILAYIKSLTAYNGFVKYYSIFCKNKARDYLLQMALNVARKLAFKIKSPQKSRVFRNLKLRNFDE